MVESTTRNIKEEPELFWLNSKEHLPRKHFLFSWRTDEILIAGIKIDDLNENESLLSPSSPGQVSLDENDSQSLAPILYHHQGKSL